MTNAASGYSMLAYEWMIDLCNRTGRDMWLNMPAFADDDYLTQLATLVNTRLRPDLHLYLEYSNEFWNWISVANAYSLEPTVSGAYPGGNQWYQGLSWCVHRALNAYERFYDVFGASNTGYGKRLCRVLAGSGNSDLHVNAINSVIYNGSKSSGFNPTYDPSGMVPDAVACAPYIGPGDGVNGGTLDGAAPDIATRYHQNIDQSTSDYILGTWRPLAQDLGVPLILYEGTQQLDTNADAWSRNPLIYDEYQYHLTRLAAAGVKLFCIYTLYGAYSPSSAWGLRSVPTDSDAVAHKFRAVKDRLAQ